MQQITLLGNSNHVVSRNRSTRLAALGGIGECFAKDLVRCQIANRDCQRCIRKKRGMPERREAIETGGSITTEATLNLRCDNVACSMLPASFGQTGLSSRNLNSLAIAW